jgi:hypothetical protein
MTDPVDPAERDPDYDWRTEVNWPHVRRLMRLHGLYWASGAAQAVLYWAGLLEGATRTLLGIADYLAWAALLVLLAPIVARVRYRSGSAHVVSPRTFLILVAFMASLFAYILLLDLIGLDTIELL